MDTCYSCNALKPPYNSRMKQSTTLFLICWLSVFSILSSYAAYGAHRVGNLDLSNNAVLCMYQDQNGYMWFGTYDGLNLYNGKNLYVYRFELDNEYSLCSNIIHKISQADADHLWISTFLGLNRFSLKDRRVTESHPECPEAKLLAADSQGNTWVICKRGYISYYSSSSDLKRFQDIHLPEADTESIKDIFFTKNDKLYLITNNGKLLNIEYSKKQDSDIKLKTHEITMHDKNIDYASYENNKIYFVDKDQKLYLYDIIASKKILLSDISQLTAKNGGIARITSFKYDVYIAFKNNGVVKLNIEDHYRPEVITSGIGVFCLLKDNKQDILWLGTDGKGVEMFYQNHDMFGNILLEHLPFDSQKPVRSIYTDEHNNLWVGTKGDGIFLIKNYDKLNNVKIPSSEIIHYTTTEGLVSNLVFCFLRSKKKDIIWLGTEGPGLSYYSYKDNKIKTAINKTPNAIGKVHSICEVNDSTLWMATAGNGLLEVVVDNQAPTVEVKSINAFFPKKNDKTCNEFHSMTYDGKSTLFIGNRGGYGVTRFNITNKQYEFIPINKAESTAIGDVLSVYQSKDSVFYFGASSGLTQMQFFKNGSHTIKQFDRKSGIINDMIHGILEDKEGCIWLSTNKGLAKYNPHNDFFHNYTFPDLKVFEFSDDAYWHCPYTGRLFFGGINGLTWLEPGYSFENSYRPDLYFFGLKISGEDRPLSNYINKDTKYLEIPANIAAFSLSFIAVDYIDGENYEYSYMLEDYNNEWTDLQKSNEITFTNLPSGDYVLKVRYKNDVFNSDERFYTLHIKKLPPWYFTTWAIVGYACLFLLVCAYIIYMIRKKIINKQIQLANKIEEEQKEKLIEAKLDFFTNVTHEFCTPLTLINGVTDRIEKTPNMDNNFHKYIEILRNNVDNLNELIQEILDFRKLEESKYNLHIIKNAPVAEQIRKQSESFFSIAEQNKIRFNLQVSDKLLWNTDIICFNRIYTNLVSNAFKYTKEGGEVRVTLKADNDTLTLKVYNTGKGIEASKIPIIFDRYSILEEIGSDNQYSRTSSRNGIGLSICQSLVELLQGSIKVESEVNKYAEFIVELPHLEIKEVPVATLQESVNVVPDDNSGKSSKPIILVVDDNEDIIWLINDILSDEYIIKGANNANDALKQIENQMPELIITDIMMPEVSGLELINQIKSDKITRHIPLVIISAKISDADQSEGLDVGADAYLTKPFSPLFLRSVINRLLNTKKKLKDYYYSPESALEYSDGQVIHQEDKEFMESVISIIDSNIEEENLRPELIAEKLGTNTRNLYRRFKKITSLTPSDFIKDYRFTCAAKLLITTNLTIQEIIYKVGINNKSYFYREFSKKYNMTPKEYRQQK